MLAPPRQRYTEAEYLALERASDVKHEFYQGEIFAMAGASPDHDRIVIDTISSLKSRLRNSHREVFSSEIRVRVTPTGSYTYPDIKVVCGEQKFTPDNPPSLLNPTLIIEVLSPSTAEYDRTGKFYEYRRIESLQEYLLIATDKPRVEHYVRQPNQSRVLTDIIRMDAILALNSISAALPLADIYNRIQFPE